MAHHPSTMPESQPKPEPEARARSPLRLVPTLTVLAAAATPSLAQLERLLPPPNLPSLPEPPALRHALLENPIPPVILALALGLAAYAIAARIDRRRLGLVAAGAGLLLGAVALLVSVLVQTKRERVQAQTRDLVAAVAGADTTSLDAILADEARLFVTGAGSGWRKEAVLDWIGTNLAPGTVYEVRDYSVGEVQAEIGPSGELARTRATVTVTPADGTPTKFVCMMTWRRTGPGAWSLIEIEPLWLQGWGEISHQNMLDTPRR